MDLSLHTELLERLTRLAPKLHCRESHSQKNEEEVRQLTLEAFSAHERLLAAEVEAAEEAASDMAEIVHAACATMPRLRAR